MGEGGRDRREDKDGRVEGTEGRIKMGGWMGLEGEGRRWKIEGGGRGRKGKGVHVFVEAGGR